MTCLADGAGWQWCPLIGPEVSKQLTPGLAPQVL